MDITNSLTGEAILTELSRRLTARRLELGLTQAQVAEQAGIAKRTLERMEAGHSGQLSSLIRILRVLDGLPELNRLLPDSGPSPMELLKHKGKKRRRAPGRRVAEKPPVPWTWGDDP